MRDPLIFACSIALAAGAEYDPTEVLRRATEKALASAKETPNYTCVETVSRDYFEPAAVSLPRACSVLLEQRRHPTPDLVLRMYSADRLRLDVTLAGKGEIYSWAGASRFDDTTIDHVVRYGPISTGSFAGFLIVVFRTDVRKYTFDRTIAVKDRTLMEYSFQVAKSDSHYKVKLQDSWVYVPYTGRFQVDPETADVVNMTITTGDVPQATGICMTATTMNFARVQIGDGQFLLPRDARQRFVYPNAEEAENTTGFTNCREFRGESTVTFAPDSESVTNDLPKSASPKVSSMPSGLRFSFGLTAPIQTDTAAAGDPFSARLVDAIRDGRGKVLAPKGTVVEGHLLRVQNFFLHPEVVVVLKPEALRIHGARVPLSAERDWTRVLAEGRRKGKKILEILLPLRGEDNSGVFRFSGNHVTVPTGYRGDWRTT
jgi:hypothetical protein